MPILKGQISIITVFCVKKLSLAVTLCLQLTLNAQAASVDGTLNLKIILTLTLSTMPQPEQMHKLAAALAESIPTFAPQILQSILPKLIILFANPNQGDNSFSAELFMSANSTENSDGSLAASPVQQLETTVHLQLQIPVTVEQSAGGITITIHGGNQEASEQLIPQLTSEGVKKAIENSLALANSG